MSYDRYLALLLLGITACSGGRQDPGNFWPPGEFGPHHVGFREVEFYDDARERTLGTAIWYPALSTPADAEPVLYLSLLAGQALRGLDADHRQAPYPLLLFSHGSQGINVQSYSLCEHLASQGFVVAAPNHQGNTLMDNPDDAQMAQLAEDRPRDIVYVTEQLLALAADEQDELYHLVDPRRLAVLGHSFGGYTTLVLAGGRVDRDRALERCQSERPDDIMCPFVEYWPADAVIERPASSPRFSAAVALAPGGYGAFGPEGLATIDMPVMVMGGDLDEFTASDIEPIYASLPPPRALVEISGAGHMSFTDICRAGLPVPELEQLCDPGKFIDTDLAFAITNTLASAWLRRFLLSETAMEEAARRAAADFSAASLQVQWE